MRSGKLLLLLSIVTRVTVVLLLCALALMTEYLNLKMAYNNPRLVELSSGKTARVLYQAADRLFEQFEEPLRAAQTSGGMTWSVRLFGVPFTDPMAALSLLAKDQRLPVGFALGLIVPLALALLFGRVFCAYICPASLLFFAIDRFRRLLGGFFYFPDCSVNRGFAWGLMLGGLAAAVWLGHGIWTLLLPYFALGQTIFHGLALGTLSLAAGSLALFAALDLFLGRQFTCRYVCPTGRLLGFIGRKSVFALRREAAQCVTGCNACAEVCPMKVSPRLDQTVDCSMCGECLVICPTQCLSMGIRRKPMARQVLECGSPLPLSNVSPASKSGRRLPQSKTLARSSQALEHSPVNLQTARAGSSSKRLVHRSMLLLILATSLTAAHAHHFKGLPHYNYFENYPQVPEEEFLGQAGRYEFSLVVYDFQGINRAEVEQPDNVRLFLVVFNLRENKVYQGPVTLEILDRGQVIQSDHQARAELENLYSLHRKLPDTGRYALRITLHDEQDLRCEIPFRLSTQKIHWGRWVALGLGVLIFVAAVGARKARITKDRQAAHRQKVRQEGVAVHA